MAERITGWCVSWKCFVACLPTDESQQPTCPQVWHWRNETHFVPSFRHSSQAMGFLSGAKSDSVRFSRCSHGPFIYFSFGLCWSYSQSSWNEESVQNGKQSLCGEGHQSCRDGAFQNCVVIVEVQPADDWFAQAARADERRERGRADIDDRAGFYPRENGWRCKR